MKHILNMALTIGMRQRKLLIIGIFIRFIHVDNYDVEGVDQ